MNKLSLVAVLATVSACSTADAPDANWYRNAAISPDGQSILFSAKGDIYQVPVAGGKATPLISDAGWDGHPVWSHDGKSVAFASNRNGSLDVYLLDLADKQTKRLTYHSANDVPTDFTADNSQVLFSSGRMPAASSSGFPTTSMQQLYSIDISGGTPTMVLTTPALEAQVAPDGRTIAYMDNKGYENGQRKHDVSAFARDIWRYDVKSGKHTQLTTFAGGDSSPVWSKDGTTLYFLSEQGDSNFNVWQMDANGGSQKQLSNFNTNPVRSLSVSDNGMLAYSWHGNLYTQLPDQEPQRLDVSLLAAKSSLAEQTIDIAGKASTFAVSPSGKEVAFVARGELFVASVEYGTTVRLTDTPEQERTISWFPDGRGIAYSAETDGAWGIYKIAIADDDEPYFFAATKFDTSTVLKGEVDIFQPLVSPDGEKLAYLHKRDEIRVLDLASGKSNTVFAGKYNYSYSDGDIGFDWSPDSQWLAASYVSRGLYFYTDIGIAPADGSKPPVDVSLSGYGEYLPDWISADLLLFVSDQYGERAHGSWGGEADVMGLFLTQDGFERHHMSKEERELLAEAQEQAEKDNKDQQEEESKEQDSDQAEPIKIDWQDMDERVVRLTKHSSELGSFVMTPNMEKLYYLAEFEKGYDLWVQDYKENSTKLALKLGASSASLELSDDGEVAVLLADGALSKLTLGNSVEQSAIAASGSVALKADAERRYMFEHLWRQTDDKFYRPTMHGIDWDEMYRQYQPKIAGLNNNKDFADLTSEMLGELNASHTGTYFRSNVAAAATTPSIGALLAMVPGKDGLTVEEILPHSPLGKYADQLTAGVLLTAVDGQPVNRQNNLAKALNGKTGQRTRMTFNNGKDSFDLVIRPKSLADESAAMYKRWVDSRRALVEKESGGKLAYVHIPQMNDSAYRQVHKELFGRGFDKQGVVIDTRFNAGGWLTDDLVTLFSGNEYSQMVARGITSKGNSMRRWTKPSVLLVNEGNYSDGNCFPNGYRDNNIGPIVGMPVPGTCTAVWWEWLQSGDLVFGIPQLGVARMDGEFMENVQIEPDVLVNNSKEATLRGDDPQLERSVKELLKLK
ncbi:tricorn protease [Neiella marina]|uniref:Tricorn protease homolog n=1 Tax=Neiella marina TaxID=508461 RepID=A0A8J2U7K6_9GAMM|nr:S41 family peptidase [Neiella marina]GGA83985.1 tricorn protease [Neiella marina]